MKVVRAKHWGMCFGVRDAIAAAVEQGRRAPLTILGELVHNPAVLEDLRRRGIATASGSEPVQTRAVMVTAHGVSDRALAELRGQGLHVSEATCPLVRFAHQSVRALADAGFYPVIVGQRDHVEVKGLTGDLDEYDVILEPADVVRLQPRLRFGVAAQTTQPVEKVRNLVQVLRERFPGAEVRWVDTVCQPTKQRQDAAVELARASDVVLVVGGRKSNNTRQLSETCRRYCLRVHQVESADELQEEWLAGAVVVGLTAGTSSLDATVDAVEARLLEWANVRPRLKPLGPAECTDRPVRQASGVELPMARTDPVPLLKSV